MRAGHPRPPTSSPPSTPSPRTPALPAMMVIIPASFYVVVFGGGWSVDDARGYGWTGKSTAPAEIGDLFGLYDFSCVEWSLLPAQFPVW